MTDEYIRKQDAVDLINKISNLDLKAKGGICVALANLKKADVVPVVRCRDCKHLDVKTAGWGICKDANGCGRLCGPNDFCSSGVRKE